MVINKLIKHTYKDIYLLIDSPSHDDEIMQTTTNDGNLLKNTINNPSQLTSTNKSNSLIPKPNQNTKSFSDGVLTSRGQRYERRASTNSSHVNDLPIETISQQTGSNMQIDPKIHSNFF